MNLAEYYTLPDGKIKGLSVDSATRATNYFGSGAVRTTSLHFFSGMVNDVPS